MIINELKRLQNESELHYLWRIDKLIIEGKYKNWKEVTPIVNKELYTDEAEYCDESAFRKKCKYARDFYEAGVFDKYSDDGYFKELELQKRELEKERQKLNATKIEYTRNIRQQSRFELFYENVREAITALPLPEIFPLTSEYESSNEYVLTIADIHAGASFISENNEYSLEICKERFEKLLAEIIKFVQEKRLTKLKIVEMGDTIQGLLRVSDLKLNESSVVETTVFISRVIAQFLNELSAYCFIDYYHVPTSNHSQTRPLGTKANEVASEDVEYVISNYIKDVLINNNRVSVNLNVGKQYINVPIMNFECVALHGHQIKDIKNSLKNLSQLHRKFYDFVFLAHFHGGSETIVGESVVGDAEVLVCPSFIGSDPYSDSLMRGSKSACKIYGFDYYNGHTESYKIILN